MSPENALAWRLMQLSIAELTRHLVEPQLMDEEPRPDERIRIRERVAHALMDSEVTAILYPKHGAADGGDEPGGRRTAE